MASFRLRAVNWVAQAILKPHLERTPGPLEARRDFDRFTRFALIPLSVSEDIRPGERRYRPAGDPASDRVILYFHGGAYICGSPRTHRGLLGALVAATGLPVVAPAYRLAPEHPAPAAFEDGIAAFRALAAELGDPGRIILGGDSAGGGLALAVLAAALAEGTRPAGLFAFSPWTDLTGSGPSRKKNAKRDRIVPESRFDEVVGYVTGDFPADDPRISPLFAEFDDPPPVLIQLSTHEILCDDGRRIADRLRAAGGQVTLSELGDAPHVWQLIGPVLPAARESLEEVAAFARSL